jgi:hypothetical protein
MSDDEGGPSGTAGVESGAPYRAPSDVEYERWWRAYHVLPDPKSSERCAAICHVRKQRMQYAIRVGWPGFPALRDREDASIRAAQHAALNVATEVEAQAIANLARVIVPTWAEHAQKHMEPLGDVRATIAHVASELRLAAQEATFVAYRRVPAFDEEGFEIVDERGRPRFKIESYVPAESVARATARLATAAKDHAILNKALLDSLSPFQASSIDFSDASDETLAYLERKFLGVRPSGR